MNRILRCRVAPAVMLAAALVVLCHPTVSPAAPDPAALVRTSTPRLVAPLAGEHLVESAVRFVAEIPVAARDARLVLSRQPFDPSGWQEVPADTSIVTAEIGGGTCTLAGLGVRVTPGSTWWWAVVARDARTAELRCSGVRSLVLTQKFAFAAPASPRAIATATGWLPAPAPLAAVVPGAANSPRPVIELEAGYKVVPGDPPPPLPARLSHLSMRADALAGARASARSAFLVQFTDPSPESARQRIEAAGGSIVTYVPNQAYLVRLDANARAKLAAEPEAPWLADWEPAYKLSPRLDLAQDARDTLMAQVFSDADRSSLTAGLLQAGATGIDLHDNGINVIVRFALNRSALPAAAALDGVAWIEPVPRNRQQNDAGQWVVQTGVPNSRRVWDQGLRGRDQVIMTSDSGVRTDHDMFRDSTLAISTWGDYPTHRKIIAYKLGSDDPVVAFGDEMNSDFHGTHTAGSVLGNNDPYDNNAPWDGMAKDARLYFLDLAGPSSNGGISPPADLNDLFLPSYVGNAGGAARISSNSWGSSVSGAYTLQSMQVDQFMWAHPDYLVAFSDGNDSYPGSVGSPATAKDCISVGATGNGSNANWMATFTSRGPTRDGRRKPTLCAPGDGVTSSIGNTRWAYASYQGTSMATPIVAGALALMRQYLTEGWYPTGAPVAQNAIAPSAALLKAMAINSGANDVLGFTTPDYNIGWGRITIDDVLYFPGDARRLMIVDHTTGLYDRQFVEYQFQVTDPSQPLEISLCWTDAPGSPIAAVQVVNDLDLKVGNGSTSYLGNAYYQGRSVAGGLRDSLNVEEAVRVLNPAAGVWTVRVEGHRVAQAQQPFALCVTGGVADGAGSVALDRTDYGLTDSLQVEVIDTRASGVLQATATSTTEPAGETVYLTGSNGRFSGAIPLSPTFPTAGDGVLAVSIDDAVTVTFAGAPPALPLSAHAQVKGVPVTIGDVRAASLTPHATLVSWTTDAPATSMVRYAATGSLDLVASSPGYSTSHSVRLAGLVSGQTYTFDVESHSMQGTPSRDSLGGAHRFFTVKQPGSVAFVLGDEAMPQQDTWKSSLRALGMDYDVLTGSDIAPPLVGNALDGLRSYAAVLWQAGPQDFLAFSDGQRAAIDSLLEDGGRLLVTGHDIGFSLGDATSPGWNPEREAWLSTTLKSRYHSDPTGWRWELGVAGDPVSGSFAGGVPYWSWGYRGAGDAVTPAPVTDGIVAPIWTSEAGAPLTNGLRWESGGPRGTSGGSFWGGHSSRLESLFFEWSRLSGDSLNITTGYDSLRTAVLDRSLGWLLGRGRPVVAIASPNGGEVVTGEFLPILFSTAADPGHSITRRELSFSLDGGQSWALISSNVTSPVGYIWDLPGIISGVPIPNSTRVLVRVRAFDDGLPQLHGEDVSNAAFTIARVNGDMAGPVIVAGSMRFSPYPARRGTPGILVATISDGETGGGHVTAAEWSQGAAAAAPGSGIAMDGRFDSVTVAVSTTVPTTGFTDGLHPLWVRGRDSAGRWGVATALGVISNGDAVLAVGDAAPTTYMAPAAPNPFKASTAVRFGLARAGEVRLELFDTQGRRVRTLASGPLAAGPHVAIWDGRDDDAAGVRAGVYFVRLVTPAGTFRSRIVSIH